MVFSPDGDWSKIWRDGGMGWEAAYDRPGAPAAKVRKQRFGPPNKKKLEVMRYALGLDGIRRGQNGERDCTGSGPGDGEDNKSAGVNRDLEGSTNDE